ncbi:MAG: hypothetical protein ACYDD1_04380 [Caulobacteraceae bacterium]
MYDLVDRKVSDLSSFDRAVLARTRLWVHALTVMGTVRHDADDKFSAAMQSMDTGSVEAMLIQPPCFSWVSENEAVLISLWRLVHTRRLKEARTLSAMMFTLADAGDIVDRLSLALITI